MAESPNLAPESGARDNPCVTKSEYRAYLQSDHWIEFRSAYFASGRKRRHRCYCCLEEKPLQLHHKTYKRLGRERASDVVPLCDHCHRQVHRLHVGVLVEGEHHRARLTVKTLWQAAIDYKKLIGKAVHSNRWH